MKDLKMKDQKYVLAIDCGTQSIRGLVFDMDGTLVESEKVVFDPPYSSINPDWAEREAYLYWNDLCAVTDKLNKKNSRLMSEIRAVTLTTQRDTCILVDKRGVELRPAILWMDQRKIKEPRKLNFIYENGTKVIGMKKTINNFSRGCHAHWLQDFEKDHWDKAYKFILLSTYLIHRLTGNFADSVSAQTGHMPLNYKKKEWDGPFGLKRNIFQIPKEKLYPILGAGETLGTITQEASTQTGLVKGLKVIASGSDKACETLGVGCIDESTGSISLGSQATIETTSDRYYEVQRFIPPFPAVDPMLFNPEINVYRGFWMISWFKNEFAQSEKTQAELEGITPEDLLNKRLQEIPPGCSGLMLQPFWGNEITRPESRGSIIGFREDHTRLHIYRAIIEGIAFALYEGMTKIEKKSGVKMESLGISGGGAQSDVICQIFADIFNRKIYRVQTFETSGLGASIAAFRGLGLYENYREAVNRMVHKNSEFFPVPAVAEVYAELYHKVYSKIYGGLKSVYVSMEKILENEH